MPNDSGLGQGMCQKVMMVAVRQTLPDHARQQGEVVILHQHDRVVGARFGHHRIGKALIDGDVLLPVAGAEHRPHVGDMAQRPQAFVGKAVVVALLFFCRQPDAAQRVGRDRPAAPATRSSRSTVSRSAEPLPCAIQVPEQARITGSTAVTRPLAGRRTSMPSAVLV